MGYREGSVLTIDLPVVQVNDLCEDIRVRRGPRDGVQIPRRIAEGKAEIRRSRGNCKKIRGGDHGKTRKGQRGRRRAGDDTTLRGNFYYKEIRSVDASRAYECIPQARRRGSRLKLFWNADGSRLASRRFLSIFTSKWDRLRGALIVRLAEELIGKQCHWDTVGRGEDNGVGLGLQRCASTASHDGSNSRPEAASITATGTAEICGRAPQIGTPTYLGRSEQWLWGAARPMVGGGIELPPVSEYSDDEWNMIKKSTYVYDCYYQRRSRGKAVPSSGVSEEMGEGEMMVRGQEAYRTVLAFLSAVERLINCCALVHRAASEVNL
ncbi:hypothetical protein FB451DRAFT_1190937 [Mycena latifolia]|nr:hypothetical protein FB451DRAFT_1190937 [Mycena latifolia]